MGQSMGWLEGRQLMILLGPGLGGGGVDCGGEQTHHTASQAYRL